MKIIKLMIVPLIFWANSCWAEEDLTFKTNRELFDKMPLLTMQPMLNYCREAQPLLKPELEQAYANAKLKMVQAFKKINLDSDHILQPHEMDQPVSDQIKIEIQEMMTMMDKGIRTMNAEKYCPYLINKLNTLDEVELQNQVERQYEKYVERAKQLQQSSSKRD